MILKFCKELKRAFGNSFNEEFFQILLDLREDKVEEKKIISA